MCFSHSSTCLQPSGENVFMSLCSSLPNLLTQSKTKIGSQFTLKRKHTVLTFLSLASRGDRRKGRKNSWFMTFSGCKKEGKGISVNCSISNSIKKINIASIYNSCVHHIDTYQSELFLDSGRNNTYLSEKNTSIFTNEAWSPENKHKGSASLPEGAPLVSGRTPEKHTSTWCKTWIPVCQH